MTERTNYLLTQNDGDDDNCLALISPYPDAYGACPDHHRTHHFHHRRCIARDGAGSLAPIRPGTPDIRMPVLLTAASLLVDDEP
jgi:hypothetical protein